MDIDPIAWVAFGGFVVAMLLVDLLVFARRGEAVPFRRAVFWSVVWTLLGVAFAGFLWAWQGRAPAEEYLAGFLIEKSLSIDNLFVFAMIFSYFAVPAGYQRRVLYWGIVGAIVLRGIFIVAGLAILDAFHYAIYLFGAFLIATGIRMARHRDMEIHPEQNPLLRLMRRVVPMTTAYDGDRLLTRQDGRRAATPLLATLALVAAFDVVFALDSIPAIFAITRETFVVYAANAFSLLGLASLYFVLAGMLDRFRYLKVGLAVVLVLVGLKMVLADVFEIPVYASLTAIIVVLAASVAFSLRRRSPAGDSSTASSRPASESPPRPAPSEGGS